MNYRTEWFLQVFQVLSELILKRYIELFKVKLFSYFQCDSSKEKVEVEKWSSRKCNLIDMLFTFTVNNMLQNLLSPSYTFFNVIKKKNLCFNIPL